MAGARYKELLINTALFAVNAVATKLVTFLLVPLYTYFMTAEEYGITDMSLTVISLVTPATGGRARNMRLWASQRRPRRFCSW